MKEQSTLFTHENINWLPIGQLIICGDNPLKWGVYYGISIEKSSVSKSMKSEKPHRKHFIPQNLFWVVVSGQTMFSVQCAPTRIWLCRYYFINLPHSRLLLLFPTKPKPCGPNRSNLVHRCGRMWCGVWRKIWIRNSVIIILLFEKRNVILGTVPPDIVIRWLF